MNIKVFVSFIIISSFINFSFGQQFVDSNSIKGIWRTNENKTLICMDSFLYLEDDCYNYYFNEDTLFPTMTKDELSHLLVELKESLSTLEKWNAIVYKTLWKDQSLKNITDEVSQYLKTEGVQKSNVRYYRNYAVALISLMSKSYTKLHSYGFDVINAALSYAEKSARQYR